VVAEAYAVALKIFRGFTQVELVAMVPWLGPINCPVLDTAYPVILYCVTSEPETRAVNVPRPTDSTNTSSPLRNVSTPVNPLRKNPSFTVGSTVPAYVKVAVPYTKETPVISRVVA